MKDINKRNKISSLYNEVINNNNKLKEKKIDYTSQKSYPTKYSYPSIIYESDWKNLFFDDNENFSLSKSYSTSLKNQKVPVKINFDTTVILDIPESWLPHINTSFLVKDYPDVEPVGTFVYNEWLYSSSNYYSIYGDSTLIYKGFTPTLKFFPESEISNGNILSALTSKWYNDSIFYTLDGENYEFRAELSNSKTYYIKSINIYYNVIAPSGPPASTGIYNYEYFIFNAIDTLTSSSVTGTGTWYRLWYTWQPDLLPEPGWVYHQESEKDVTKTIPFSGSYQLGVEVSGRLFKEEVDEGFKSDWDVYDDNTPVDWALHKDSVFTSFTPTQKERTFSDKPNEYVYKLHYDEKRVREFTFSTSTFNISNIPMTADYETATLPYTKISVDVNPGDEYPEIEEQDDTTYIPSIVQVGWGKITDNKYKIFLSGILQYSALASEEGTPDDVDFVNEDYNSNGTTFVRVPATRGKEMPLYIPSTALMLNFKFILSLDNNFEYREVKDYE